MKSLKAVGIASLIAVVLGVLGYNFVVTTATNHAFTSAESQRLKELEDQLNKVKQQEENDARLGQYAINMMYKTYEGKKLSDGKKIILARAIVRVANDIFETEDHKKAFIAVLAIESQFKRLAQSPTGPKGYAQVARNTFHEAMGDCGVKGLSDDDVWETDLNLYAGACYFRKMMEANNGDPYIAIVAYNQGPNDSSIKTFAKSGELEKLEPLKYVAKFTFFKRTTQDTKVPNVPAMADLPTPGKAAKIDSPVGKADLQSVKGIK